MMTTRAVSTPIQAATETPGCWANFVSGAGKTVNWCGRQIAVAATAVWGGIQKIATWAAAAFKRLAFHAGIAFAAAITYVKAHSTAFIIGGSALAAGIILGLLFNRACGCCNKPTALQKVEAQTEAVNEAAKERADAIEATTQNLTQQQQELAERITAAQTAAVAHPTTQPAPVAATATLPAAAAQAPASRVAALRGAYDGTATQAAPLAAAAVHPAALPLVTNA